MCLLTKSLKSMAVLMNISRGKRVPSSAGTDLLTANVIEHHLKAAHGWKNTLISKGSYYFHTSEAVLDVTAVTQAGHSNNDFDFVFPA